MGSEGKRFLILKLSSLGDIVHALPVLRALRKNHPGAFIAWVVEEHYRDLLTNHPDLDEFIAVRTKYWRKNWNPATLREIWDTVQKIRGLGFDTVLDLQGLLKTGIIAAVSGAPVRVGFHRKLCKEKINALFTNRKGPKQGTGPHVVDLNLTLAEIAGGDKTLTGPVSFKIPEGDRNKIETSLQSDAELAGKPLAAINPGAGFESKQWDLIRFAGLADKIVGELGFAVILTWGPGEEEKVNYIADRMEQPCRIAPPTTIPESIALYERLSLMVSCDSGPLHLCGALGIPTVSIFGPTDPARNGPYGPNHEVVCKVLACSFCWKRRCPLGTGECMDQVTVEEVFQAVKRCVSEHVKPVASPSNTKF